jgi:uncharacterized protein (DUF1330 family)
MTLVVILAVLSEKMESFRSFETKAAAIMAKYGGAIERSVVIPPENEGGLLKEVHIVTFPDERALAAYRDDNGLREIAHLREESVVKTEIMVGEDGPDYRVAPV